MTYERQKRESDESNGHGSFLFRGCLCAIIVLGILGILGTAAIVGLVMAGQAMSSDESRTASIPLKETVIAGDRSAPKIAVIPVEGLIHGSPADLKSNTPVTIACARLQRAAEDPEVVGVLLQINSPGGGITASDILHHHVQEIGGTSSGKPVVAHVGDIGASGGYYVATAADKIWAHPTSILGSIGVIMPLYDATGLMKKLGIENESVASGPYKSMGSPFAEKSEKQEEEERRILQDMIDELNSRFIRVVAKGRNLDKSEVRKMADGRIFTSDRAKNLQLIDAVGYQSAVVEDLKQLCDVEDAQLISYRRVLSFPDMMTSLLKGRSMRLELPGGLDVSNISSPMYLWAPALGEGRTSPQSVSTSR